jgi:Lon protease-like protein
MSLPPFTLPFEQLPETLPIFPLANAIVMPGCHLPLTIFEPRYLEMVFDSIKEARLIGMIQPEESEQDTSPLYRTGTAGRVVSFNELPDERLLIVLSGICRFDIRDEIPSDKPYRKVAVDWSRFRDDYIAMQKEVFFDRTRLMSLLKTYFERKGFKIDWSNAEEMPVPLLVNALAGQLPFASSEKQALVEAVTAEERISRLIHLLEFDEAANAYSDSRLH